LGEEKQGCGEVTITMNSYNMYEKTRLKNHIYKVNIAPCKDCPDRSVGCHSTCQGYNDWLTEMEKLKAEMAKQYDRVYPKGVVDKVRRY
jgi:radical SAM superfamily enzyme